jgi:hypothetical protein
MKIVIDVDKLLEEDRITTEEYERLNVLAVQETGSLAFNILIGFGVIATAGGALALLPSGPTAILLGFLLSAAGILLSASYAKEWGLLGSMLLLVGSITAAGGILFLTQGGFFGFLVLPATQGVVLQNADMLISSGVVSNQFLKRRNQHVHQSVVSCVRRARLPVLGKSKLPCGNADSTIRAHRKRS